MINILLTGVTGFVGSNLVAYFDKDPMVKLYGHSRDLEQAMAKFNVVAITFLDDCSSEQLVKHHIDVVIHLAGIAHDLSNTFQDADYFRVNFEQTCALYDNFKNSTASKFIYFSSIKAVVDASDVVITETHEPAPTTAYGQSKLKAEHYIQSNTFPRDKTAYILRPCMIHGPDNKGNLNLLYRFVKSGVPYPFGAFENKRSFLGAANLCFIIAQLSKKMIAGGIYNVADTESLSTVALVRIIAKTVGKRVRILALTPFLLKGVFKVIGKDKMLAKLTDNMVVSNNKIVEAIGQPLPFSVESGVVTTIQSFHD